MPTAAAREPSTNRNDPPNRWVTCRYACTTCGNRWTEEHKLRIDAPCPRCGYMALPDRSD